MGIWLEIVTLLIPGFNDSHDELERLTAFIAGVSPDIPWHVTAFHGDYRMTDPENTTPEMLLRAAEIGRAHGLRYVYAGNLPGRVGDLEDTRCQQLPRAAGRALRLLHSAATGSPPTARAPMRHADSRPLGRGVRRPDHVDRRSCRAPGGCGRCDAGGC